MKLFVKSRRGVWETIELAEGSPLAIGDYLRDPVDNTPVTEIQIGGTVEAPPEPPPAPVLHVEHRKPAESTVEAEKPPEAKEPVEDAPAEKPAHRKHKKTPGGE